MAASTRVSVVPLGAQHPVLPEPVALKLSLEEEKVVDVSITVGYCHRGIEKAAELNDFKQNVFLCGRVCGICSHHHTTTYSDVIETMMKIEVPERAKLIRTIVAELERLHSHTLILGLTADAMGYENLFMQTWRDREIVMDLFETISGNRVHYDINQIGGVRRDIGYDVVKKIEKGMDQLEERFKILAKSYLDDPTFKKRTKGVGVLSTAEAHTYGVVGPVARGSDVPEDIRASGDVNYAAYNILHFTPQVEEGGDIYSRTKVRVRETFQSIDLIRQAIGHMRDGPIAARVQGNPNGEALARVEAPRGELFYYAKGNNTKNLDRVKIRTPSYVNIPALKYMILGEEFAAVPVIIASIDPCLSCTDR
ncbi:MAG: nickel-dependent hydrogenase large subunit [Thermoplasmata archaeon]